MDLYSFSPLQDMESMLFWSFSPEPFCVVDSAPAPLPEVPRSAFARYAQRSGDGGGIVPSEAANGGLIMRDDRNVHRRAIDILRRIPGPEPATGGRGFRHMMRERQRREKMSQCYADLHSILPYVPKGDKNTIVQSAATCIKDLKRKKEELQKRNEELHEQHKRSSRVSNEEATTNIKIREENPTSTVESMIGALRCLKAMDVKARAICCEVSGSDLTAIMGIEPKILGENKVNSCTHRVHHASTWSH